MTLSEVLALTRQATDRLRLGGYDPALDAWLRDYAATHATVALHLGELNAAPLCPDAEERRRREWARADLRDALIRELYHDPAAAEALRAALAADGGGAIP